MTKNLSSYINELDSLDSEHDSINAHNNYNNISVFENMIDNPKEKIEFNIFRPLNNNEKIEVEGKNNFHFINNSDLINNNRMITKKNDNKKNFSKKITKFICTKRIIRNRNYRKDAYIKHFKAIFGKYLKNKLNSLKDKCFPFFSLNRFSTPNYSFIGNPKKKDNYTFLSWKIKDILVYGENKNTINRQYNNKLIIQFIENNHNKSYDKISYNQLVHFLNNKLEIAFYDFYNDKAEFDKLRNDVECIFDDKYFQEETGVSLLEKFGFLKVMLNNK